MKKRITSIITSLFLVLSLVSVMPVITASAKTTFTITNLQSAEWDNCFPKWTDGTGEIDDCIDARSFKKNTPLEVTVNFQWTDEALGDGYVCVKPASAAMG